MCLPFGPRLIGETEKTLNALLRIFLSDTGLTEPQWVVMQLAAQSEGCVGAADLAETVADRAHFRDAGELVAELTGRGLLDNGSPTPAGLELITRVRARTAAETAGVWQGLRQDDVVVAAAVLNDLVARARAVLAGR